MSAVYKVHIKCDFCRKECPEGSNSDGRADAVRALKVARGRGWKRRKNDGTRPTYHSNIDICPDCQNKQSIQKLQQKQEVL